MRRHDLPRFSVSKLGEYSEAVSPFRRQTLIREQKFPDDFIVAYYAPARRAIVGALSGDPNAVPKALAGLASKRASATTDWEAKQISSNLEALAAFVAGTWPTLSRAKLLPTRIGQPKLEIAGVQVSVEPDLLIVMPNKVGGSEVGLVKLYIVKSHPLGDHGGSLAASVCHQWAIANAALAGSVTHKQIYVLDIFRGRSFAAPKAFKQRMNDASAACREIATQWPSISKQLS